MSYIPQRGDFIWLQFSPQKGHEQQGARPALVISHSRFNKKMGFAFVCPISSTKRHNPFYVRTSEDGPIQGVIMVDQLRSLDFQARQASFVATCSEDILEKVLSRLHSILF